MGTEGLSRLLISAGVLLVVVGFLFRVADHIPWLGRLPGDIVYKRGNLTVYFPVATMLIISVLFSILLALFRR